MQAWKCDRCKRFYDFNDKIDGMAFVSNRSDGKRVYDKVRDLCPECVRQLTDFMKGDDILLK